MGRGTSKVGGGGSGVGGSQLPDLPGNVIGGKRKIFHDTMNSAEARGSNKVHFSGDMQDAVEYGNGWSVKGSYEIMAQNNGQDTLKRVSGEMVALNGRLYGIEPDMSNYRITDLRTGMLITGNAPSKYAVWNSILTFNDGLSRNKAMLDNFEKRFANAHK